LPVIEIKPALKFYDYDSKYKDKRTQYVILKSSDVSSKESLFHSVYTSIQELATRAHDSLGCRGISRVDMIFLALQREVYYRRPLVQ
jgi:D-alanine-D-alanine ligase